MEDDLYANHVLSQTQPAITDLEKLLADICEEYPDLEKAGISFQVTDPGTKNDQKNIKSSKLYTCYNIFYLYI